MKRKYGLLTKASVFYLLFTLVSFLVSGIILQHEANRHMDRILTRKLEQRERWIKRVIKNRPAKLARIDFVHIVPVDSLPSGFEPVYSDTIILDNETRRMELHRKRLNYISVDGKHYRVEIFKEAEELYRFKDDVFRVIMPVFIILALVIILTNSLLSRYIFEPFRYILRQMAAYQLSTNKKVKTRDTTTKEFYKLQELFLAMQKRIEDDYFRLKEYTENMSHELHTPLSIIRNRAEQLLNAGDITQKQVDRLKDIYDETLQLSRMGTVMNLLTKIDNNEFSNVKQIASRPVIMQQVKKIHDLALHRHIEIITQLNTEHTFTMDSSLFDIMIRNLLKNAVYYATPESKIYIITDKNKLIVRNRGEKPDFPPEKIFSRFKRGKNSSSLGLGLAIVRNVCKVSNLSVSYKYENRIHEFIVNKNERISYY